jgi:TRAP-type C4-dicarboxylate transport system permease small subunit
MMEFLQALAVVAGIAVAVFGIQVLAKRKPPPVPAEKVPPVESQQELLVRRAHAALDVLYVVLIVGAAFVLIRFLA